MDTYAVRFLYNCVRTKAFKTGDFKLKSGRPSKYFFNLGDAMMDGMGVSETVNGYAGLLKDTDFFEKYADCMNSLFFFGPAYKGIPLAGAVVMHLYDMDGINVRWGYDRKEIKDHGADASKWLVGDLRDGDIVVIFDDVITTSATKREAWEKLSAARQGLVHGGIVIGLDRQETDLDGNSPVENLKKEDIDVHTILQARTVFDYLHDNKVEGPDGSIVVDDQVYADFQAHQEKYGIMTG